MARGRQTLTQRIALDGGDEIKRELSELGRTGEQAFRALERAAARSGEGGTALQRSVRDLQRSLNEVGKSARQVGRGFREVGQGVSGLGRALGDIGKRLAIVAGAAAAAGGALFVLAKNGAAAADEASKQAQALGLPIDAYGRLQFAAEQSGVSAEQFSTAISRLNQELGRAAQGNETAAARFTSLGVAIRGADGNLRSTEDILGDLAERFERLPDSAEKSALAIELFGRSGARLLPFLNEGRAGLAELGAEAERLGLTFTEEQAVIGTALQDSLNRLSRVRQGLTNELGLIFAPGFTQAADGFTAAIVRNRDSLIELAENVVPRATRVLTELFELFVAGGGPQISELDPLTVDIAVKIIEARDAFTEFGEALSSVFQSVIRPALDLIRDLLDRIAGGINALTGSNLDGLQLVILGFFARLLGLFKLLGPLIKIVTGSWAVLTGALGLALGSIKAVAAGLGVLVTVIASIVGFPALIAFAVGAALTSIVIFWDEIKAGAVAAFDFVVESARSILGGLDDVFSGLGLDQAWESIKTAASRAFKAVALGALALTGDIDENFRSLVDVVSNALASIGRTMDAVVNSVREGFRRIPDFARSAADTAQSAFQGILTFFERGFDTTVQRLRSSWDRFVRTFRQLFTAAVDIITSQINRLSQIVDNIIGSISRGISRIRRAISSVVGSGGDSGPQQAFATGGAVRGPGTATSDSILAWLSDGEFVVKAKAVRHYGKEFLAALNGMRLPKGGGGMPGFANGGPVSVKALMPGINLPAFSMGGLAAGFGRALSDFNPAMAFGPQLQPRLEVARDNVPRLHPLNLTIGGETFSGLMAPEQTAQNLMRAANNRTMVSGGRKPGWYFG